MRKHTTLLLGLLVVSAGCYRATIETGRAPSGVEVRQDWAHSFIAGLVPPATVETAARCPNGVAQVQTQRSFLNMLAYAVTSGIYSPMTLRVQGGAAGEDEEAAALRVPRGANLGEATDVFNEALSRAAELKEPVRVQFD
jgi:hypothetical protein